MDKATFEKLKELLICGICRDPIINGISLDPCQHLFCSYCFFTSKRALCPLCNVNVIHTHNCSRPFINSLSELVFGEDYRESAMSKLKTQFEANIKNQIIATLPVRNLPVRQANIIINPSPVGLRINFSKLCNNYVIFGLIFIIMSLLMIINGVYLNRINNKLSL